jgi:DNA-binding NarL/FixJ family response regulator
MIKLLIADDHKLVREGLKTVLRQMADDIEIVGEAATGKEVLRFLETNYADVVLMDIDMPDGNGIETTLQLKGLFPEVKVIMLTMADNEKFVKESLEAGANGYVLKVTGGKQLLLAIRTVAEGEEYFSSELTKLLLHKEGHTTTPSASAGMAAGQGLPLLDSLSKREMEVLQLIAQGYTNGQIADMTFTSRRTVESHRQNLLQKTGCNNTATLIRYAAKNGLLS